MLRLYRRRLPGEEIEDCYSQATLELLASVRRGRRFCDEAHIANALSRRVHSRVEDRRRARRGRSSIEAALWGAERLEVGDGTGFTVADPRADVHELVCLREDLGRLRLAGRRLSDDQRLVLASQVTGERRSAFCARHGWSAEKYRKVAQRARARLRVPAA